MTMKNNRRILLQNKLCKLLNSNNVYFQPPESIKLKYPCIIYELAKVDINYADNIPFIFSKRYIVTYIDKDPDNEFTDILLNNFNKIQHDRNFKSDGFYHSVFSLYF